MRPRRVVRVVSLAVLLSGPAMLWAQGAAGPQPQMPVRVGGAIRAPQRIFNVDPVYPAVAQNARVQGVVILEVTIGTTGHVEGARILRGVPLLDQAALDAVQQWQYTPTLLNGVAVPVIMTVTVNFALQDRPGDAANVMPSGRGSANMVLSDEDARREPFLLAPGRAGLLQLGMPVDALYRRIPRPQTRLVDVQQEGNFTPAIEIRLEPGAQQPAMRAWFRGMGTQWIVWMLEVDDARFRTSDGLGVGSTLADIHAIAPVLKPEFGEHGPVVAMPDRGILFWLDPTTAGTSTDAVPETAVVRRVTLRRLTPTQAQPPPPARP
jgi:TonB family protein